MTAAVAQQRPTALAARSRRPAPTVRRVLQYVVLIALTVLFVSPVVWMAVTSFKTQADAIARDPQWIPRHPTVDAYRSTLTTSGTPVLRWFVNSLVAATCQALLVVATASLAAYALARMEFRGKRVIFAFVVSTLFVPSVILIVPNYIIVGQLRWLDSLMSVIVPGAASAFGVFFLRQFFLTLPTELEEAALVDGAGPFRIFWSVVLPLSARRWSPCCCSRFSRTGTTSSGRCTCCSAPTSRRSRLDCPLCRPRTPSAMTCSWPGR